MKKSRQSRRYRRVLQELKNARLRAQLTQAEVAQKLEAHASYVSKCESGERRIDVVELADFCKIYSISIGELLDAAGIN